MKRYQFKVLNPESPADVQGEDFRDDEAAWREATVYAGELLKECDRQFRPGQEWTVEVADEAGNSIFNIHISTKNNK